MKYFQLYRCFILFFILFLFSFLQTLFHTQKETFENLNNIIINDYSSHPSNHRILTKDLIKPKTLNMPEFYEFKKIDNLDDYSSFILVIDMPNYGGGTTFFINTIVSMYKKSNILILRNFNGILHVYINDVIKLNKTYYERESIQFLEEIKPKIIKIFVNHISPYQPFFLDYLFLLDKPVTGITHDYLLIAENPQPLFSDLYSKNLPEHHFNINKFNNIITQNSTNLEIFMKYLKYPNVDIVPLPDYQKPLKKITNNNPFIVIGIIGNISHIKGAEVVKRLSQILPHNEFKLIVFGTLDGHENQYPYKNVYELNHLLTSYKPNVLIETSIWPETYSYTLTLAMITDLPILYLDKDYPSVVESRLQSYSKKYKVSRPEEIIQKSREVKQDYFYTISPEIYFNSFWDDYFES